MKVMRKQSEEGQSLIEFMVALPILLLILSGLLDFGRVYYTFIALEEAVAEAALFYAIRPDCPAEIAANGDDLGVDCTNPNNVLYRAENSGNNEWDPANAEWNIPFTTQKETEGWEDPRQNGCASIGCNVLIQVEYEFEVLTPGIRFIVPDETLTLRTQAAQVIVYDQPE